MVIILVLHSFAGMVQRPSIFNPQLSVDCVVFGFDGEQLQVLLVERSEGNARNDKTIKYKLPGDLIHRREDLDRAAERILSELTGLQDIYLRQFSVFGDPDRIPDNDDRKWLEKTSGVTIDRVVTTAYYSLIRIDKSKSEKEISNHASWHPVQSLPPLIFDHEKIVQKGLFTLRKEISFEPICFELLPGKFTIRQIQNLYEAILGQRLDNRNFRKKLLKAPYLERLNEKQTGVAHKPAIYYRYNREKYEKNRRDYWNYNI